MPWRSDSGKGRLALQALLEQARQTTWRLWAREAAIEFGQPKCWYRDVSDADKAAEAAWLGANVMGPGEAVWALRISTGIGTRIVVGAGANVWACHEDRLRIALEGAGAG